MKPVLLLLLISCARVLYSQTDTTSLVFTGYTEIYYAYDFNRPEDHNRPSFLYSHNRHNEFNLNLGFIKATYDTKRVRANLALAAGTYMNANYAAEPGVLKNMFEANVGYKLSRRKNLWLDAGIFSSHIGFESAVSNTCWTLTRSMAAENSPYYEAGAKLTYISDDHKWLLSGLLLNGWQHIQRPEENHSPAIGTQIAYSPNEKITLNYSTFIGNDKPDTSKQTRYFNNFYSILHFTDRLHITVGFDYGIERKPEGSNEYNQWYTPQLILMYNFNDRWSISGRGEYYSDKNQVIIATGTENGFQTLGYSINIDYRLSGNALWRVEGRQFTSKDNIFRREGIPENNNFGLTTSMAVSF